MKRLISALMVKQAHADGKTELVAPKGETIVTPEAMDLATKLGMRFIESTQNEQAKTINFDKETVQLIVKEVLERLPVEKRNISAVTEAVMNVLSKYKKSELV